MAKYLSDQCQAGPHTIAIFTKGPAHKRGPLAPLELEYDEQRDSVYVDIEGSLPYLQFRKVLDDAEERECVAGQDSAPGDADATNGDRDDDRCSRLKEIRARLLDSFPTHKVSTVYQNERIKDQIRSVI